MSPQKKTNKKTHGRTAPLGVKIFPELLGLTCLKAIFAKIVPTPTTWLICCPLKTGFRLAGCKIQWDNTHTLFRGLWVQEETEVGKKCVFDTRRVRAVEKLDVSPGRVSFWSAWFTEYFASLWYIRRDSGYLTFEGKPANVYATKINIDLPIRPVLMPLGLDADIFVHPTCSGYNTPFNRYWVHTIQDLTQWAVPFNMNDFKREEIDREVNKASCFSPFPRGATTIDRMQSTRKPFITANDS